MLLEGKSAVIMGAGSGVGRASALRFAEEGAKVVVADVDLERAKETVRLVEEAGGTADRRPVRRVAGGRRRGDHRARGLHLRSPRHHLQQRRRADAAARV